MWANEGFERLACVDAADVVGEQLASLFDVGIDDGEELLRSLELGRVSLGGWRARARRCNSYERSPAQNAVAADMGSVCYVRRFEVDLTE